MRCIATGRTRTNEIVQCSIETPGFELPPSDHIHTFVSHYDLPSMVPAFAVAPRQILPWVEQKSIEKGASEWIRAQSNIAIKSVAAFSESELDARLIIQLPQGPNVELPLAYLAHLWPAQLQLLAPIMISRDRDLILTATGASALVVLNGIRS